jgi:hypothetical protein
MEHWLLLQELQRRQVIQAHKKFNPPRLFYTGEKDYRNNAATKCIIKTQNEKTKIILECEHYPKVIIELNEPPNSNTRFYATTDRKITFPFPDKLLTRKQVDLLMKIAEEGVPEINRYKAEDDLSPAEKQFYETIGPGQVRNDVIISTETTHIKLWHARIMLDENGAQINANGLRYLINYSSGKASVVKENNPWSECNPSLSHWPESVAREVTRVIVEGSPDIDLLKVEAQSGTHRRSTLPPRLK